MPLPNGRKTVSSKCIFMIKQNADDNIDKFKARLLGHGYVQKF
jgi:hypothetical protein